MLEVLNLTYHEKYYFPTEFTQNNLWYYWAQIWGVKRSYVTCKRIYLQVL